jgi:hypothetical protein
MSTPLIPAAAVLAAKGGEAVKSGPWGLAIILILCVACYFLIKSMSKHLRRVREQFPRQAQARPEPPRPPHGEPAQGPRDAPTPPADPPA